MEVLLKQLGGKQGIKQLDAVVLPLQNVRCVCVFGKVVKYVFYGRRDLMDGALRANR
jgi:hypothetical protein